MTAREELKGTQKGIAVNNREMRSLGRVLEADSGWTKQLASSVDRD